MSTFAAEGLVLDHREWKAACHLITWIIDATCPLLGVLHGD